MGRQRSVHARLGFGERGCDGKNKEGNRVGLQIQNRHARFRRDLNIHPVDLPMYYSKEGVFELKTAADRYPTFFRYPSQTGELLQRYPDFFDHRPEDNEAGFIRLSECPQFFSFYSVRSDGRYYNFFDIPRKTTQRYKRLKVFADVSNR